jgi:hypothetical protein
MALHYTMGIAPTSVNPLDEGKGFYEEKYRYAKSTHIILMSSLHYCPGTIQISILSQLPMSIVM